MSQSIKEILRTNRPKTLAGRGDKYLPDIAKDIRRQIVRASADFLSETLLLEDEELDTASVLLAEFAEDLHNDAGLWRSLENWNREFFGTPLPFFTEPGESNPALAVFDEHRVGYFLWHIYPILFEGLILSPTHHDLRQLAKALAAFLPGRFAAVPRDSSVAKLLTSPNDSAREVKRKLIWLGGSSYLFRDLWWDYFARTVREPLTEDKKIQTLDDFLNQECTIWSGLGPIDILAGALDISAEDRAILRSWHARHLALYEILEVENLGPGLMKMKALNLVGGGNYTIRMELDSCPFGKGAHVFGSLVPWCGEWYWSGTQQTLEKATPDVIETIRRSLRERQPQIVYRYCLSDLEKAREVALMQHRNFVEHHGSDFVEFPDGLSMAASEQVRLRNQWEKAPREDVEKAIKSQGLEKPGTDMKYPPEVLNHTGGLAIFSNPEEGQEITVNFHAMKSALQKRGADLTEAEARAVHALVTEPNFSPSFLRLLIKRHGAESVLAVFHLNRQPADLAITVLRRRYKGEHYRPRTPAVSLVD
jgi:hypothetical protein